MTNIRLQEKQPVIKQTLTHASEATNAEEDNDYLRFARLFLRSLPVETLNEKTPPQHTLSLRACWQALQSSPVEKATVTLSTSHPDDTVTTTHTILIVIAKDMPWLVESIRTELNRNNITIHHLQNVVLGVQRDHQQRIVSYDDAELYPTSREAVMYIEIDRHSDDRALDNIQSKLANVLDLLYHARQKREEIISRLRHAVTVRAAQSHAITENECRETDAFIDWLTKDNFLFLGCEELILEQQDGVPLVKRTQQLGPVIFSEDAEDGTILSKELTAPHGLIAIKKDVHSAEVYRQHYYHQLMVVLDDQQRAARFYGLFTANAIITPPEQIPLVRKKIAQVRTLSGLQPDGHNTRELTRILNTYPWEELLIANAEELRQTALGIYNLQERRRPALFVRVAPGEEYISCLYFVPKDTYCTALRLRVQAVLRKHFSASNSTFNTFYSDSILSRTHFYLTRSATIPLNLDEASLHQDIASVSRSWQDQLYDALQSQLGEEAGNTAFYRFGQAFSQGYKESYSAEEAVKDIGSLSLLTENNPLTIHVDTPDSKDDTRLNVKLFSCEQPLMLSGIVPILDNTGVTVESENTWPIVTEDRMLWLHQFTLFYTPLEQAPDIATLQAWRDCILAILQNKAENDRLNRLVLDAGLTGSDITVLRALTRYMHQLRLGFSQQYIIDILAQYPLLARELLQLFKARLDPDSEKREILAEHHQKRLLEQLEQVTSLNDERVFRSLNDIILAIVRTSFWQSTADGEPLPFIAFKLRPGTISGIRQPCPEYEIFIYSPQVEGVHLRFGKVARGGLRWSDRNEDYRTEVLGLVKAQRVKNAVIVPVGAKGGFVVRQVAKNASREAIQAEGIACYQLFIRGLLSLTDNLVDNRVIPPSDTWRYDGDDPYLVVAADKGTATFSDIANDLANAVGFWAGDAFASGGSHGYDHKKMGITARGAWESVKRHFYEQGRDAQSDAFTVVGIGDMAGDVFGNGMLLSPAIRLVAAFNHKHIFIDPEPDCVVSFQERHRLFTLPGSNWSDYSDELLSSGGGIFSREQKRITITPEMRRRFSIEANTLSPNELIKALLRSKVDMLWNGGIGTYVKASSESHTDVGDKNNDSLRIDASELRCKMVAEGGNLGLTQLARCEFAASGGAVNSDFIDNAGGVDCSDHEVNIKILLNMQVARQKMTLNERNTLLSSMSDAVANSVLNNNRRQVLALSMAERSAVQNLDLCRQQINQLEQRGELNRELEYLPDDASLLARKHDNKGLTRPELAVLLSYTKSYLKQAFIESDLSAWPCAAQEALLAFPPVLTRKFRHEIAQHPLHREIVATRIANEMVNRPGLNFSHLLQKRCHVSAADTAIAWLLGKQLFSLGVYWQEIERSEASLKWEVQAKLLEALMRFAEGICCWLLMNQKNLAEFIQQLPQFSADIQRLFAIMPTLLQAYGYDSHLDKVEELQAIGIDSQLIELVCNQKLYLALPEIIVVSRLSGRELEEVAHLYLALRARLKLDRIEQALERYQPVNEWQSVARETWLCDLTRHYRKLIVALLRNDSVPADTVDSWLVKQQSVLAAWDEKTRCFLENEPDEISVFALILGELQDITPQSNLN